MNYLIDVQEFEARTENHKQYTILVFLWDFYLRIFLWLVQSCDQSCKRTLLCLEYGQEKEERQQNEIEILHSKKISFGKIWQIDLSFSLTHSLSFLQCFRFRLDKPSATLHWMCWVLKLIEGRVCSPLCRQCNSSSEPQKFKFPRVLMQLGVCVAFGHWTPS